MVAVSPLGWIAVGLLGGAAAGARYVVDAEVTLRWRRAFPLGILLVNLTGTALLGLVAGLALDGEARTIVAGAGVGSFTTFSTWILDSHRLGSDGEARLAALNIGLSVAVGFAAVVLGHWLGTRL
ncbi:MAG: fluoride efflux transporter CrcB [Solirubrobacterales bacterium]